MTRKLFAGNVAAAVSRRLADPLRSLRDRLGLIVDQIERHVATSTGPAPYPWRSLQVLRQELAATYLEATQLARRLDELDRALAEDAPAWFDLAEAVELGIGLASEHLELGIELLIDLGPAAVVRGVPGTLALVVAQLVEHGARSARAVPGSSLSVRVVTEGGWAVLLVADNGAGAEAAATLGDVVRDIVAPWGASLEAASEPGQGSSFELRLIARPL